MTVDCILTKLLIKEIPAHIVYEDDVVLTFLDISTSNTWTIITGCSEETM